MFSHFLCILWSLRKKKKTISIFLHMLTFKPVCVCVCVHVHTDLMGIDSILASKSSIQQGRKGGRDGQFRFWFCLQNWYTIKKKERKKERPSVLFWIRRLNPGDAAPFTAPVVDSLQALMNADRWCLIDRTASHTLWVQGFQSYWFVYLFVWLMFKCCTIKASQLS